MSHLNNGTNTLDPCCYIIRVPPSITDFCECKLMQLKLIIRVYTYVLNNHIYNKLAGILATGVYNEFSPSLRSNNQEKCVEIKKCMTN